jgi:hypothetical protein
VVEKPYSLALFYLRSFTLSWHRLPSPQPTKTTGSMRVEQSVFLIYGRQMMHRKLTRISGGKGELFRFNLLLGVDPEMCSIIWERLVINGLKRRGPKVKHILWALLFLWGQRVTLVYFLPSTQNSLFALRVRRKLRISREICRDLIMLFSWPS